MSVEQQEKQSNFNIAIQETHKVIIDFISSVSL